MPARRRALPFLAALLLGLAATRATAGRAQSPEPGPVVLLRDFNAEVALFAQAGSYGAADRTVFVLGEPIVFTVRLGPIAPGCTERFLRSCDVVVHDAAGRLVFSGNPAPAAVYNPLVCRSPLAASVFSEVGTGWPPCDPDGWPLPPGTYHAGLVLHPEDGDDFETDPSWALTLERVAAADGAAPPACAVPRPSGTQ